MGVDWDGRDISLWECIGIEFVYGLRLEDFVKVVGDLNKYLVHNKSPLLSTRNI